MSLHVGFQGEPGAFSEEAAIALFGQARTTGFQSFDALVQAVESGQVELGLLPCENTIYGPIARAYDLLLLHPGVHIVDETTHRVVQALIGVPGAQIDTVECVASHPVALEQCRAFLARHPSIQVRTVDDTAGAVREVVERADRRFAAIGPALAARRYGAQILADAIQDDAENLTRFFAIARDPAPRRNLGRACLAFGLPHEPGSLYTALGKLASRSLNLRSLVARPTRANPFEYTFYAEIECPPQFDVAALAQELSPQARVLGRY